jgi:hypothetical protein
MAPSEETEATAHHFPHSNIGSHHCESNRVFADPGLAGRPHFIAACKHAQGDFDSVLAMNERGQPLHEIRTSLTARL